MDKRSIWQKTSQPVVLRKVTLLGGIMRHLPRHSPRDVAELHSDALRHAPLRGKHPPILLLIVHQLTLYPSIAPVDLIQPGHLSKMGNIIFKQQQL